MNDIPMGWYREDSTGEVRWWNGNRWQAFRISGGHAKADWFGVEPPAVGFVFGVIWICLGLVQLSLSIMQLSSGTGSGAGAASLISVSLLLALGIFFFVISGMSVQLRRMPGPSTPALAPEGARPVPGEQEGPGAGWYPVSPRAQRWFSGARWGHYLADRKGVRPTFTMITWYRVAQATGWMLVGIGVLLLVVSVIGAVVSAVVPEEIGILFVLLIIGPLFGVVLLGGGIAVLVSVRTRRPETFLPTAPPNRPAAPPTMSAGPAAPR